jgi:RNA polymerase sigma factor (sigma-70 family)
LIQKILQGSVEHYKILIEKYQKQVYYTIYTMLERNMDEAEDITQEAFISAYRNLSHFRYDASFSTWVTKIAIHRALDHKRKKARQAVQDDSMLEQMASAEDDPLAHYIKEETKSNVKIRINELPPIYRQVIYQYYFHQLSYQEMAVLEGVEIKTIESRLYRARSMLKKLWKEEAP